MPDIKLVPIATADVVTLDWLQSPMMGGLPEETNDLKSAVIVALCSDALAAASDVLPDPNSTDRRGWWGDYQAGAIWGAWPLGSKLWLLMRAKILGAAAREGATTARVQAYISAAMQPFVNAKLCSAFTVSVAQVSQSRIDATVTMYRGPKTAISLQFQALWDALAKPAARIPRQQPAPLPPDQYTTIL